MVALAHSVGRPVEKLNHIIHGLIHPVGICGIQKLTVSFSVTNVAAKQACYRRCRVMSPYWKYNICLTLTYQEQT